MSNLRIVPDDVVRVAHSITPTPAFSAGDPNNIALNSRSKVVRFDLADPVDEQEISIRTGTARGISAVVLGRHNFTPGVKLRIQMYSDVDGTFLVHDSQELEVTTGQSGGELIGWGDFLWGTITWGQSTEVGGEFTPEPNYVYWVPASRQEALPLLAFAGWTGSQDCGGPAGVTPPTTVETTGVVPAVQVIKITIYNTTQETEIGRVIIGAYVEPTYNLSYGHAISWEEPTKQYRTDAGTLRSDIGVPIRKLKFDLGTINAVDRTTISQVMRTVGKRRDFYLSLFPEDTDEDKKEEYSGIVKLTKIPSISEFAPLYYKSKYEMEEV